MDKQQNSNYVRRTQKDYTLSFKLQVVREVEAGALTLSQAKLKYGVQGDHTISRWLQKYGNLDWETQHPYHMKQTPEQRILELEAKNRLLEKQKEGLERELKFQTDKAIMFDMMIDIAENELNIPIRKKSVPEALKDSKRNKRKR